MWGRVVELDSTHIGYPSVIAKDIVIRAKVKKFPGKNVAMNLRYTARDSFYVAWFAGGNYFGMEKAVQGQWQELKTVHTDRQYDGHFEMEFAAIGDILTLRIDGQEIIRLRDQSHDSGTFGIVANAWPRGVQPGTGANPRQGLEASTRNSAPKAGEGG